MNSRALSLALALAVAWHAVADDKVDAESEAKKMQGSWVATSLRMGEADLPKEEIEKGAVTLVVKGDRFTFKTSKETHEGTLQLDPSKSPRTMDLTVSGKEGKKKTILCVYEWDGERLRMAGDQEKRPKDFKSKLGGAIVATFKRAKE